MSQIAVQVNDSFVNNVVILDNLVSKYASKPGWTLVDSDPAFSIENKFLWTVRESDNKLVHISTGMTPDEESTKANALLGQNVGKALAQADTANTTAQNALDIANKSVTANAEIGKLIAPLLAAQQNTSNTTGGTN